MERDERKGTNLDLGLAGADLGREDLAGRRRCTAPNRRCLPCRTTFSLVPPNGPLLEPRMAWPEDARILPSLSPPIQNALPLYLLCWRRIYGATVLAH
jgi:hypothetical protein